MRAVVQDGYGGTDVLRVTEVDAPRAADDELLVEVRAVEVTKTDVEQRHFRPTVKWFWLPLRLFMGIRRPRRPIPGMYLSGVVCHVGAEVEGFAIGDEVFGATGMRRSACAQVVSLPANAPIALKPPSFDFADAAALMLGGVNALHFMRAAEVQPGERVLVIGAGGVIGAYGVQIAAALGAQITGVDAGHKREFVESMGASTFINYQERSVGPEDGPFDVVFDMVPTHGIRNRLRLLAPGGRWVHGNPRLSTMLLSPLVSRLSSKQLIFRFADENRQVLRDLVSMVEAGEIRSIVDRVLPLDDVREAHRLVDTEERIGAIVLAMEPPC